MLEGIYVDLYSNYIVADWDQLVSEVYISHSVVSGSPTSTSTPCAIRLFNGSTEIFRLVCRPNALRVDVFNGTAWVIVVPETPVPIIQELRKHDYHIKFHATDGRFRMKKNGVIIMDYAGPLMPSLGTFDSMGLGSWSSGYSSHGEVIIATENTENMRAITLNYLTDGTNTEWSGGVSDINWAVPTGSLSYPYTTPDSTFITPTAPEQTETFTARDLPAPFMGGNIHAVIVAARGQVESSGVTGINGVVRVGGVNYEKAPQKLPELTLNPTYTIFDTNPATGLPWTDAEVNGAEFGYRSKA